MQQRLASSFVGVSLLLAATTALAAEPGDVLGKRVALVAADVTFRSGPSADAPIAENPTGGHLSFKVYAVNGDWLEIKGTWLRRDDVLPLEEAVDFFSAQIERKPTPFAYASRSEARRRQYKTHSHIEKALADAEEAIKLDPNFAVGYCARANAHFNDSKLDSALRDFDKALALEPNLPAALSGRKQIHQFLYFQFARLTAPDGNINPDPESFTSPLDDRQLEAVRLFDRARERGTKGENRQAIADLEEAVRLAPELRTAGFLSQRSDHYLMLHEYEKAVTDLREAISLQPKNADHHESLARAYRMQGDLDGAIAQLVRAYEMHRAAEATSEAPVLANESLRQLFDPVLKARSELLELHMQRAHERYTNGDIAGAMADFDRTVELDSQSMLVRIGRAIFLAQTGKYEQALKECDVASNINPASSYPMCTRGAVYQIKGDLASAINTFNNAVIQFPQDAMPLSSRAEVWMHAGELGKAFDDLTQAIALEPEDGLLYGKRAGILRRLKRNEEAEADLTKARALILGGRSK